MTLQVVANAYVALFGLLAIALALLGNERGRAWAPFVGLSAQPGWLYLAWTAKMPGVAVVTLAYTAVWFAGCVREVRRTRPDAEPTAL